MGASYHKKRGKKAGSKGSAKRLDQQQRDKLKDKSVQRKHQKKLLASRGRRTPEEARAAKRKVHEERLKPEERKAQHDALTARMNCGNNLNSKKGCASNFGEEMKKVRTTKNDKSPKELKNEYKVLAEARKEATADVFTACGQEKKAASECLKEVNTFWVTAGGKPLNKAARKALLKQAAAKKAQKKSNECNAKDLADDAIKACINVMLTDLKERRPARMAKGFPSGRQSNWLSKCR